MWSNASPTIDDIFLNRCRLELVLIYCIIHYYLLSLLFCLVNCYISQNHNFNFLWKISKVRVSSALIPAWVSNHMSNKVWDGVTYLFPNNHSDCAVGQKFHSKLYNGCNYVSMVESNLNLLVNRPIGIVMLTYLPRKYCCHYADCIWNALVLMIRFW